MFIVLALGFKVELFSCNAFIIQKVLILFVWLQVFIRCKSLLQFLFGIKFSK
jgi:hypothetical protein